MAAAGPALSVLEAPLNLPVGDVAATAVLVRPDGYVAWASSADIPDTDELRGVLARWFGI